MQRYNLTRLELLVVLFCLVLVAVSALSQTELFDDGFENLPPVIVSSPVTEAIPGEFYFYDVDATDSAADILTYQLVTAPAGMVINAPTGEITWFPEAVGENNVTVRVTDGMGGEATQAWVITVRSCSKIGAQCSLGGGVNDCCTGRCDGESSTCCVDYGATCVQDSECCGDQNSLRCNQELFFCCVDLFGSCTQDSDCCADKRLQCDQSQGVCCGGVGAECSSSTDCCSGMECFNFVCKQTAF